MGAHRIVVCRGDFPLEVMPEGSTTQDAMNRCKELDSGPDNVARHMEWGFGRISYTWHCVPEGSVSMDELSKGYLRG